MVRSINEPQTPAMEQHSDGKLHPVAGTQPAQPPPQGVPTKPADDDDAEDDPRERRHGRRHR